MSTGGTLGPAPDPVAVLRAHRSAVTSVVFHPPTGFLLSGDADGELKIWDVKRRRPLSSARVHAPNSGVIGIGTSHYLDSKILSQGRDGNVRCWQLTNGGLSRQPLLSFKTDSYHFCKLSVPKITAEQQMYELSPSSPSDNRGSETPGVVVGEVKGLIAIVGEDPSTVDIWDVDGGTKVQELLLPRSDSSGDSNSSAKASGMCMALKAFQEDAGGPLIVAAGYEDGSMAVWDIRNPKVPRARSRLHSEPVISIDVDTSFSAGVSGSADDKLIFFSLGDDEGPRVRKEIGLGKPGIADIAIRQDDIICATAGWDHRVRIYDYQRRRPLAVLKYHASAVTGVVFSDDRRLLASASTDATIALWSIYSPKS